MTACTLLAGLLVSFDGVAADDDPPETLQSRLSSEPANVLVADAKRIGDAARGALLFHQRALSCTKCHSTGEDESPLGPNLATAPAQDQPRTAEVIVDALLAPSKRIRDDYRARILLLDDGQTLTGLVSEENDRQITLRDPEDPSRLHKIPRERVEAMRESQESLMPAGLINVLAGREQFLDLLAYLLEINAHGVERAKKLKPDESLYAPPPAAPDTATGRLQVYRTMMPDSGPASLAICLGGDLWACFDPQRGGVNYIWRGELDLTPTVEGKINRPAALTGRVFFHDNVPIPLRTSRNVEERPPIRFRGYRFLKNGVELRYAAGPATVREQLTALPPAGLLRRLEIAADADAVWMDLSKQAECRLLVEGAERAGDLYRIGLSEGQAVVTITIIDRDASQ